MKEFDLTDKKTAAPATPSKSASPAQPDPDFFDVVREQLRFWPYTLHQIDNTLDIGLIEGRGKQLLFRAINSSNLTAFAGSGLSLAYGRLSWSDWEREQRQVVERNAETFLALTAASLAWIDRLIGCVDPKLDKDAAVRPAVDGVRKSIEIDAEIARDPDDPCPRLIQEQRHNIWRWLRSRRRAIDYAQRQIERLQTTFLRALEEEGDFPGGEALPVKFEIAQQLHDLLRRHTALFLPSETQTDFATLKSDGWSGALQSKDAVSPDKALVEFRKIINHHSECCMAQPKKTGGKKIHLKDIYLRKLKLFHVAMSRREAHLGFEALAKTLVIDECPHAMVLLRKGFLKGAAADKVSADDARKILNIETKLRVFETDNHKRDIDGIREKPDRYRVLSPFKFDNLKVIRKQITAENPGALWDGFLATIDTELDAYEERSQRSGDRRVYLTPTSRFLVPTYLALCKKPIQSFGQNLDPESANSIFAPPKPSDFTSRRSIIADRFDPLAKSEGLLGINKYITTNYDFEIERFYQDRGYRGFPPVEKGLSQPQFQKPGQDPTVFRADGIGGELHDQTFDRKRPSELISFTLNNRRQDAGVFHLHGRATKNDPMVITERDYMAMYLTQDTNRDTVDESITTAFSGAPLLFLGLGMKETDLLRPLRQFISNRDRTVGYTSIALLPAENGIDARTKFSAALYLRYGVHTIFYGSGHMMLPQSGLPARARGIDWLHRILTLKNTLSSELEIWTDETDKKKQEAKIEKRQTRDAKGILEHLSKEVGTIKSDLADGTDYPAKTLALNVLFGQGGDELPKDFHNALLQAHDTGAPYDDGAACLRVCIFSATRPHDDNRQGNHRDSATDVDGTDYLGFYTKILDSLLKMTLKMPDLNDEERESALPAMKIALDGLHGAFLTGALNAALVVIAREQASWWKNWQEPPPHRIPEFQTDPTPDVAKDPSNSSKPYLPAPGSLKWRELAFVSGTRHFRHRVDNALTRLDTMDQSLMEPVKIDNEPEGNMLAAAQQTGVRAFDTFITAVHDTLSGKTKGRRIITVAAHKGLGKGTFMSTFGTPNGMSLYEAASRRGDPPTQRKFLASVFINFSFSPEISSCFDALMAALVNAIAHLQPGAEADEYLRRDALRGTIANVSRLRSLRVLFDAFRDVSGTCKKRHRLLIALSPVELLFNNIGAPKNGEIAGFLELIFSPEMNDCPVDFVWVGDERRMGWPWSGKIMKQKKDADPIAQAPQYRLRLDRVGLGDRAEERIQQRLSAGTIKIDEPDENRVVRQTKSVRAQTGHFIHVARPANPVSVLIDNFPALAVGLYLARAPKDNGETELGQAQEDFKGNITVRRFISDQLIDLAWRQEDPPEGERLQTLRGIVRELGEVTKADLEDVDFSVPQAPKKSDLKDMPALVKSLFDHADPNGYKGVQNLKDILMWRMETALPENAQEWRDVRHRLGGSRFALTILLAAAEHLVIHAPDPIEGAKEAEKFIRKTVDAVSGIGRLRRDEMVLHAVLECYRRSQRIADPDLDPELHLLILRHLAVIGAPVSAAVLIRLPEFRSYFERIRLELPYSRRRHLVRAMTTLSYRGLIFRLDPNHRMKLSNEDAGNPRWPPALDYRYALHRVVQSYGLSKLEAAMVEPLATNSFAPTIYAAMPSSGPTLSRESYRFLRSLMIGLSQYPDVPDTEAGIEPWLFTTREKGVRAQALRCALTMARSTFSVAVVSRLADQNPIGESFQKRGHLETYRVRLRWIIRMAWELIPTKGPDAPLRRGPDHEDKDINALYRDEIVWLYNELGVISLAQGSLTDALGYLRQAAEFNEHVEGPSRQGPFFNHIDLNHAVVQLERGQLRSAETRLKMVRARTIDGDQRAHWCAKGHLALLDHITGRFEGLDDRFREVTEYFQERNEVRAAAIFLMHRGRFLCRHDPTKSLDCVERARDLAETGGHEDIRHHIELARIAISTAGKGSKEAESLHLKGMLEIEEYGRRMAIWSLQCDAQRLRARFLLQKGETTTAGRLLVRSITLAQRNSMHLRINSAMTIYAETLMIRGDHEGAARMAQASLEKAKGIGYNLETPRVHRILEQLER